MSIFGQSEYDGQFDQLNIPVLLFDFNLMASLICQIKPLLLVDLNITATLSS